ncbi:hypothetical protein BLJ79_07885 [Arthrobacter sp. UCD-GKA]|nr:hypothetical protein BLJ79_07885 [Arthrobacter sp. UCD-GKA]
MGRYPTGVVLISSVEDDGTPVGMIVGTFASVSLDPPLVSFMPARTSTSWPRIRATGQFAVNVLGATQEQVCRAFSGRNGTKFDEVGWSPSPQGSPVLDGAVAWMDCTLTDVFEGGDHEIALGKVEDMDIASADLPLLFFQGGFGQFTPHSMVTAGPGLARELALVDRARPEIEALAHNLGCDCLVGGRADNEIVLLASAGQGHAQWIPAVVGERLPLAAPVGRTAMAWAPPEEIEQWVKAGSTVSLDEAHHMLDMIRTRGYSVSIDGDALEPDVISGGRIDARRAMDPGTEVLGQMTAGDVHSIAAPILGADGTALLIVSLYGLPKNMSSADVSRYANALVATTNRISAALSASIS